MLHNNRIESLVGGPVCNTLVDRLRAFHISLYEWFAYPSHLFDVHELRCVYSQPRSEHRGNKQASWTYYGSFTLVMGLGSAEDAFNLKESRADG